MIEVKLYEFLNSGVVDFPAFMETPEGTDSNKLLPNRENRHDRT